MTDNVFLSLTQNAVLLLAVAFIYDLMTSRYLIKPGRFIQVVIGIMLGILGCILILSPWTYVPGIVFDTRSVLLCVSGLFFGAIPTMVAMAMTAILRFFVGGPAAWTGVAVILATGSSGILWRHFHLSTLEKISWRELYLFGILVHVVMLALMFILPWKIALQVLSQTTLPVMLIYPLATTLLGMLMVSRLRRERDARKLEASEERMRLFFERQIVGMAITSPEKGWLQVNDELCRMLGYSREELAELNWEQLTHPDDLEADLVQFNRLLSGVIDEYSMRKRFFHKDGSIVWTELSIGCVRRIDRKVDYVLALLMDITQRKRAEDDLQLTQSCIERLTIGVFRLDEEGRIKYVNTSACERLGYSCNELLSMTVFDINPVLTQEQWLEQKKKMGLNWSGTIETLHRRKDGSTFPVEVTINHFEHGTEHFTFSFATDISERKQAEKDLLESEERYRTLVNNLPGVACRCLNDAQRTMIFLSSVVKGMTGYPATDFIDNAVRSYISIIHPDDRELVHSTVQQGVGAHLPFAFEYRLLRSDNTILWVYERGQGVFDTTGKVLWIDGVICDITKQRQAQEEKERLQAQLLQAQKMESVGRLAGGVAHDFNNMLQTIIGYSDLSLDQIEATSPVHEGLVEIRKAAMRSADLTRQLLAFARKQTAKPKIIDLNDTVAGMLKMLQRLIGENIDLAWLPGHGLWPVKMDPSQLDQILANLMINARDAIADTGRITIETDNISLDTVYCADHPGFCPGEYVLLVVSDNGCGIDKEILAHIFEPFFTTKEKGKGTGLGLATVYGIVKQNNGFVNVYSEPGQGTTFRIYLPSFTTETVTAETQPAPESLGGTETVLLVEDEAVLLNLAKTILKRLGYNVLSANTPMAALQLVEEHTGGIDLLITDVVMPEMNGRELAQRLSSLRPTMRCLYMSGYTANVIAHHGVLDTGIHFIQKPFSVDDLARSIRETLQDDKINP
ncbi:MAG: PAS domain S-box protein [Desulfocapsaceae bacterium]|nr:PAS domain S-box protein [Desulfocapsaceae bacterium]